MKVVILVDTVTCVLEMRSLGLKRASGTVNMKTHASGTFELQKILMRNKPGQFAVNVQKHAERVWKYAKHDVVDAKLRMSFCILDFLG
jgi:hypothetical protein